MNCLELLGGNSTDRQLIECIANTNNKQSNERLQSVALVFAGFLVFVMQVCCSYRMRYNFDIGLIWHIRDLTVSRPHQSSCFVSLSHFVFMQGWICNDLCRLRSKEEYSKHAA